MSKPFINPEWKQHHRRKAYLLHKTNGCCYYCGDLVDVLDCQIEHVIPRSKGGAWGGNNQVASCYKCNLKKGVKTIEEFRVKLFGKRKAATSKFYFEIHNLTPGKHG